MQICGLLRVCNTAIVLTTHSWPHSLSPALLTCSALVSSASRPWLRAYLPCLQPPLHYDPFNKAAGNDADEGDDEEDEDDEEEDDRAKRAAVAAGGDGGSGAVPERPRAPGELRRRQLLEPPGGVVRLLVLVATRGLKDGEELLQNYRMNPHVRRPDWWVEGRAGRAGWGHGACGCLRGWVSGEGKSWLWERTERFGHASKWRLGERAADRIRLCLRWNLDPAGMWCTTRRRRSGAGPRSGPWI